MQNLQQILFILGFMDSTAMLETKESFKELLYCLARHMGLKPLFSFAEADLRKQDSAYDDELVMLKSVKFLFCSYGPISITHHIIWDKQNELQYDKTNKVSVCPAKTQISLGISPVWSESSLSAWRKHGSLATHWAHSEDWSDWADAQADLSLRWVHSHFVGFVMSWFK